MNEPPEEQPIVRAIDRLSDLIGEDIEMRRREAVERSRSEQQTAVERYARRHADDRPHQFSFLTFARAVPGLLAQFTATVPGEFWTVDSETAVVACPCGETPNVPFNSIRDCGCERIFAFTGREVRVANSPKGSSEPVRVD